MPAIAAITLTDDSAVNHVFNPQRIERNIASYRNTATGIPAGFSDLTLSLTEPSSQGSVYRVQGQLSLPKINEVTVPGGSVSSVDVVRVTRFKFEFIIPVQSELTERADALAMARDLLSDAVLESLVEQLQNIY